MSCNVMSQDSERSEKSTSSGKNHGGGGILVPNGPGWESEVGSGKWEKLIIRSLSVQSTNPGSLVQTWVLGFKENIIVDS